MARAEIVGEESRCLVDGPAVFTGMLQCGVFVGDVAVIAGNAGESGDHGLGGRQSGQ